MIDTIPLNGTRIQDELQKQLNNLQNR
jgi:hypothetical protein